MSHSDIHHVNLHLLRAALRAHAEESRALKAALRRTWTTPMGQVQRALRRCQRRTTELCILRAFLRGRMHLEKPLREGAYPGMSWDGPRYHALVAARLAAELFASESPTKEATA